MTRRDSECEDRWRIRDTVERYSDAVTSRDWEALAALFHPAADWEATGPLERRLSGREAIVEGLRRAIGTYDMLVQSTHSVIVELHGDQAEARTVLSERARKANGGLGLEMNGIYHDRLACYGGAWVFTHRRFVPLYIDRGPLVGQVVSPRPS